MNITQSYAKPSGASERGGKMAFELSTEGARPGVSLSALILDSPGYARAMLALHRVVSSDERFQQKDHTAYQEWVQARYIEMLGEVHGQKLAQVPAMQAELKEIRDKLAPLRQAERQAFSQVGYNDEMWNARTRYWKYLRTANMGLWYLLDPVVSVHPDATIFEVFSQDESSYARVVTPSEKLDTAGTEVSYGTTNVDFSQRLADELMRVRTYRPAMLEVGAGGVSIATTSGEQFEKKIDLPPSWVRGFLQVQSAAGLPGEFVTLSSSTVAEMLAILKERREKESPRAIRFTLAPGQKPVITMEPWNIEVREPEHVWNGSEAQEIRIWGRRRLLILDELLPFATKVKVKLLGSGMPSYWAVEQGENGHRFELGLSGWTKNDWSSAARFDLLASTRDVSAGDVEAAASQLEKALCLTPDELAGRSDLGREAAGAALQALCREGRAMFDIEGGFYRWRQLLPFPAPASEEDGKLKSARSWVADGSVRCDEITNASDLSEFLERYKTAGARIFRGIVRTPGGVFNPSTALDGDGRAVFAQCDCGFFRTNKLKKGPCGHILALSMVAGRKGAPDESATRFKDQTWVFTGVLSLFTREAAEEAIRNGSGTASGSVSRNTTFLVAGEKAGSKLVKAKLLGVPVLTEKQFMQVLAGSDPRELLKAGSAASSS